MNTNWNAPQDSLSETYPQQWEDFSEVHADMGLDLTEEGFREYLEELATDAAIDRYNDRY